MVTAKESSLNSSTTTVGDNVDCVFTSTDTKRGTMTINSDEDGPAHIPANAATAEEAVEVTNYVSPPSPVATRQKQIDLVHTIIQSKSETTSQGEMTDETAEEKKESEPLAAGAASPRNTFATVAPQTPAHIHRSALECESMILEAAVDDYVGCMDGVDVETTFEARFHLQESSSSAAEPQQLLDTEFRGMPASHRDVTHMSLMGNASTSAAAAAAAAVITTDTPSHLTTALMPPLDAMLNVCGNDDSVSEMLCEGVVLPIDTTLPTSLPGNELVDARLGKSARSLVDVAEQRDNNNTTTHLVDESDYSTTHHTDTAVDCTTHDAADDDDRRFESAQGRSAAQLDVSIVDSTVRSGTLNGQAPLNRKASVGIDGCLVM
jgi:hypothetical protein